jgi:hypothetical protein
MKIILLVIGIVFVVNSNFAFAKDMYFDCPTVSFQIKYTTSLLGKGKVFKEVEGEWIQVVRNLKITDDKIILSGYKTKDSCGPYETDFHPNSGGKYYAESCEYKVIVSTVLEDGKTQHGQSYSKIRNVVTTNGCTTRWLSRNYPYYCQNYNRGDTIGKYAKNCAVKVRWF